MKKKGKGRVLALGFGISHVFDYHVDLIKDFASQMGIKPSIAVKLGEVTATVRSTQRAANKSRYGFLFLSNYKDEPENVKISLRMPGERKIISLPERGLIHIPRRSASVLPLNVPLSEEIKIRWSTVEILEYKVGKPVTLLVRGVAGRDAEIVLSCVGAALRGRPKKPKIVRIDGKKATSNYVGGLLKIHFKPNGKYQKLSIPL